MRFTFCALFLMANLILLSQSNIPAPYCFPTIAVTSDPCNQFGPSNTPGNPINDFIDDFSTSGALINIVNNNSGCNGMSGSYIYYCNKSLKVLPGSVITCTVKSGLTWAQGFALFVDWDQDNSFQVPNELVGSTGVPPAGTPASFTFTVPLNQASGVYRMRLRMYLVEIAKGTYHENKKIVISR